MLPHISIFNILRQKNIPNIGFYSINRRFFQTIAVGRSGEQPLTSMVEMGFETMGFETFIPDMFPILFGAKVRKRQALINKMQCPQQKVFFSGWS